MTKTNFAVLALALILAGCSSAPKTSTAPETAQQELVIDKQIQPMGRNEVILAIQECEVSRQRAVVIYGKRKINGYTTEIVVDVTCAPKYP
jgi:PBP1b-binding outer membrane lipoprotein LpoB